MSPRVQNLIFLLVGSITGVVATLLVIVPLMREETNSYVNAELAPQIRKEYDTEHEKLAPLNRAMTLSFELQENLSLLKNPQVNLRCELVKLANSKFTQLVQYGSSKLVQGNAATATVVENTLQDYRRIIGEESLCRVQ